MGRIQKHSNQGRKIAFANSTIPLFAWTLLQFVSAGVCWGQDKDTIRKDDRKPIELPGLVIDFQKETVDVEATVCLDKGLLELVACSKGSKEHEAIVAVHARGMHIHTALLLLGAKNGNPATRKQIGKEEKRWVDLEPKGDPIQVSLVFKKEGKTVERSISDFIIHAQDWGDLSRQRSRETRNSKTFVAKRPFSNKFLFAGSQLTGNAKGPRQYLADKSGNIISIVTFGDELLCLPQVQSHQNGSLMWRLKPDMLPKVGTKVTLRLRLHSIKPSQKSNNIKQQNSDTNPKEPAKKQ